MNNADNTGSERSTLATAEAVALAAEGMTYGVEIETTGLGAGGCADVVAAALVAAGRWVQPRPYGGSEVREYTGRGWRTWAAVHDGSIQGSGAAEVVTPILCGEDDLLTLQEVVRALRRAGARSSAAAQCGVHVHVGVEDELVAARTALVGAKISRFLGAFTAPERAIWARPMDRARAASLVRAARGGRDALLAAWYGTRDYAAAMAQPYYRGEGSRYAQTNLHSWARRNTVEFRVFDGTLHAGKIRAYVELARAIVAKATLASGPLSAAPLAVHRRGDSVGWQRYLIESLGLAGPRYATARLHLDLARLAGQAARGTECAAGGARTGPRGAYPGPHGPGGSRATLAPPRGGRRAHEAPTGARGAPPHLGPPGSRRGPVDFCSIALDPACTRCILAPMDSTHMGDRDYYLHVAIGAIVTALQYLQLPAGRREHAGDVRKAHAQLVRAEAMAEAAWAARVAAEVVS